MTKLRIRIAIAALIFLSPFNPALAFTLPPLTPDALALQAAIEAAETTTLIPADQLPPYATFFSAQFGVRLCPAPCNAVAVPCWLLADGTYILDDLDVNYDELEAEAEADALLTGSPGIMASSILNSYIAYGNPVYLTNMAAFTNGSATVASFSIAGGTNNVPYDILTSTNITQSVSQWSWLGIGYTSNRYTFSNQPPNQAYYILAKPSKTMTVGIGNDVAAQCDVPFGLTNALQVAGGGGQSLAVKTDGTVVAWGANYYGEGAVPTNLTGVAMVAAGWYHDVALFTNGTVTAWGYNFPAIGWTLTNVPANLTNVILISAQALHTLALRNDGTVVAWGNSSTGETNIPSGLTNVSAISAGFRFNLAVSNSMVVAWGDNSAGQCNVPAGLTNVVDVEAGPYHSLALLKNGTVVAWGDNVHGETNVPAGLSNVVAIAAGGDPDIEKAYSMALKSDGTVVVWGDDDTVHPFGGLTNVIAIAAGADHALAIRTRTQAPVITLEPVDQYVIAGSNVTFTSRGSGLDGVNYQWQTNGVNLTGATNASLTLTNVQADGDFNVLISDSFGAILSSNVHVYVVTPPAIVSQTTLSSQLVLAPTLLNLSIDASAVGEFNGFPLSYRWQFNGTNVPGITSSNWTFAAVNSGTYSVTVSNAIGTTNASWLVTVILPGGVLGWGSNTNGQLNVPSHMTNVLSIAAGKAHGVVALETGAVTNWGSYWTGTNYIAATPPPTLTNAVVVAAGTRHDLALLSDGTVTAWGLDDSGQTDVPAGLTNATAISAGGQQSLVLKNDGTVVQWGQTNALVPAGLTNVTAIASGTNFHLALLSNSTVVAWGVNDSGQTNVPLGVSNVVAIAAAGSHALALKVDGTLLAWGALTNIPVGLSNVMNVAAGEGNSVALKNDGTVVVWGDNSFGQTNGIVGLGSVKFVVAGGDFCAAIQLSPFVQYPVDVSKDLLLIYNTNSADSYNVLTYYLQNRPFVGGANLLGIGYTNAQTTNVNQSGYYEIIDPVTFTNNILAAAQTWLRANPTKRPQYVILFPSVPSIVFTNTQIGAYPWTFPAPVIQLQSVQCFFRFGGVSTTWNPFVTSINMDGYGGTNDCIAYINKLAYFGMTYSPGKLIIRPSERGYGGTNYLVDDVNNLYCGDPWVPPTTNGLASAGVPPAAIHYLSGCETAGDLPHATNASNVAGYIGWGAHSSLGNDYPFNGVVQWSGDSGWWIIRTEESYNGERTMYGQGIFLKWYASNAFGGTNYSNTPIGGPTYTDEPGAAATDNALFFNLWASHKNLAICSWNSWNLVSVPHLQVVGDPFVTK
ncbi:MAG: hypothetical protein C5B50_14660 [Verrucomicrobia bacterium]|nr:MAG: hypothetical protein C5B50_14660 [Verrucomicrobiota bacterium]